MKKRFIKILICAACLIFASLIFSSCGISNDVTYISDEEREAHILKLLGGTEDTKIKQTKYKKIPASDGRELGITGMIELSKNDNFILYLDLDDTSIAVYDIKNGTIFHSDPSNAGYIDENQRLTIGSPLALEAYDALNKRYEFNFYENCYEDQGFVIADMGDGKFRIIYTIGNDPNKDLAPPVLTTDTYDRLYNTLDKLSPADRATLVAAYKLVTPSTITMEEKEALIRNFPTLDWQTLYIRRSLTTRQRASLTEAMKAAGFTASEVKEEMEKTEYQGPERSVMYTIPVDLILTDYGLEVSVDSSLILAPSQQRLYKLSLYRGLGASNAPTGDEYMLVPDGSGAIIPANGSLSTLAYSERIYGADETLFRDYNTSVKEPVLTAIGIYDRGSQGAMAAIMSDGAAQSILTARPLNSTSNLTSSVNYEFIYDERDYRTYISSQSGTTSSTATSVTFSSPETGYGVVLSKDIPEINFTVKYYFLEGGQDYSDYAAFYRNYLINEGLLPSEPTKEKGVSLYLDFLGSTDVTETVVGFPTVKNRSLTTYSQLQEVLSKLSESGVNNLKTRYSYWSNGGYYNSVVNTVRLDSVMGSQNDLKSLVTYCTDNGIALYPTADFMHVYKEIMGDGINLQNDSARRLDLKLSRVTIRDRVTGALFSDMDASNYKSILSQHLLPGFADSYKESYENTVGLQSISLDLLGAYVNTNYKTNNIINRDKSLGYTLEVFDKFADYKVAVSQGNDYTWKYADAIYDIPQGSSEFNSESHSVPFIQMVLHGYVSYAGDAFNVSGDYETEVLRAVETGSNPSFKWMYENDTIFDNSSLLQFYTIDYRHTYDRAVNIYKELNEAMADVVNLPITDHRTIDAKHAGSDVSVDNVFSTTYGDGYKTFYVNYNNFDVTLPDGTTLAAKSYIGR